MATIGSGADVGRRHEDPPRAGGQTTGRGHFARGVNVGEGERVASAIGGGALLLYGLSRGAVAGWGLAGAGAALAWRGISGVCPLYRLLGIDRAGDEGTIEGNLGVKVDRSIVVNAPPERIYAAWRNLENLPRFMSHLQEVEVLDRARSRWTVKAPAGIDLGWDAEIINEIPNELIAWRSVDSTLVRHAGSVHFERAPDGRSTLVRVSLQYDPPGGELGHAVLRFIGENADGQIAQDLIELKRAVEAGELAA
ncbi:MAG: SRPBCC family protein [Candidatus Rokubacteria bacterium]|nr:SRPBCC family protein [Candidatus Rokubacteria bacterium]